MVISDAAATSQPSRTRVLATLALGVLAVSAAAIFIRYAQRAGAPSLTIAAGRLLMASLVMVPIALISSRASLTTLNRGDWARAALVGALLAAHFWAWIASLAYVSVAISTVLVTTTPVWVALGAWVFRGERLAPRQILGLLLAVAGSVALAVLGGDMGKVESLWTGALLALGGAWAIAGNLLIGQSLRGKVSVRVYAALAYGWAAVWLVLALIATGTPWLGLAPTAYAFMLALALVPQVIGHTALNWALPFLGATTVAVSVLGEPIGAALIATWLLNEPVSAAMVLCFGLTLLGIVLVAGKK